MSLELLREVGRRSRRRRSSTWRHRESSFRDRVLWHKHEFVWGRRMHVLLRVRKPQEGPTMTGVECHDGLTPTSRQNTKALCVVALRQLDTHHTPTATNITARANTQRWHHQPPSTHRRPTFLANPLCRNGFLPQSHKKNMTLLSLPRSIFLCLTRTIQR